MKTEQTVCERYTKEFKEIEQLIESTETSIVFKFQLRTTIKALVIRSYYEGKADGIQQMYEILKD